MKPQRVTSLVLAVGLLAGIVFSGNLSAAEPAGQEAAGFVSKFRNQGKIDDINIKHNHLVVDDSLFELSSKLLVYGRRGEKEYTSSLRKGVRIGFNTISDSENGSVVSEIVILP